MFGRPLRHRIVLALAGALALAFTSIAEAKIKIAFVGDSSADGLWGGVTRMMTRDACLAANFEALRLAKNGTGLTRPDKMNWVAEVARINEKSAPDLYVISLGLNDRQGIVEADGGKRTAFESPDYPNHYRDRAAEMIKAATASGAGVIWVSLAAMRENPANVDAAAKNRLFAAAVEAAGKPGVQFVDRRKFDAIGGDTFNSYAQLGGSMTAIRQADGVHFTAQGEDVAAAELLPRILSNLRARNVAGASECQK